MDKGTGVVAQAGAWIVSIATAPAISKLLS